MPGLPSSKKVSRAARTGGSSRRRGESPFGFYTLLLVIVLVGGGITYFSRAERVDATTPNKIAPLEPFSDTANPANNRAGDHWYEAYGIYVCDKFIPNIDTQRDAKGLTTQNDGVIYIHPDTKANAGPNATLGRFSESIAPDGFTLTSKSLKIAGDNTEYISGETKCGDTPGKLVVKQWDDISKPDEGKVLSTNPFDVRVTNKAAVVLAFVPEANAAALPLPDSAKNGALDAAQAKDRSLQTGSTAPASDSSAPVNATTETSAAPTATTAAAPSTTAAGGQ